MLLVENSPLNQVSQQPAARPKNHPQTPLLQQAANSLRERMVGMTP
jgi:hypothetical protein